jgi:hypothetical protein
VTAAAKKLGISRRTLHRKINEMNLAKAETKATDKLEPESLTAAICISYGSRPPKCFGLTPGRLLITPRNCSGRRVACDLRRFAAGTAAFTEVLRRGALSPAFVLLHGKGLRRFTPAAESGEAMA